jgi:hypothetical protein
MQQQPGALQMAQELMPQAGAFGRAFDQAGNVGHDEALLGADTHHAQIGVQRRERIVGDLGLGVGDRGDQRGLARIGHAQQAHVGQHAQFQLTFLISPGQPGVF